MQESSWQAGLFVYGLEADFGLGDLHGKGTAVTPPPAPPANDYKVNLTGNIRGRLGYAILPATMIYMTGGWALLNLEFRDGATARVASDVLSGWVAGGGVDRSFSANLVGRIEYLYADYGNRNLDIGSGDIYNIAFKSQTLRAALIWKF